MVKLGIRTAMFYNKITRILSHHRVLKLKVACKSNPYIRVCNPYNPYYGHVWLPTVTGSMCSREIVKSLSEMHTAKCIRTEQNIFYFVIP